MKLVASIGHSEYITDLDGDQTILRFYSNELARLIVLQSDDYELRTALLNSGKELTRDKLNKRISRDGFWSTVVGNGFNCTHTEGKYDFTGKLIDISWSIMPGNTRVETD